MRTEQIIYLREINHSNSLHKASESLHISTQALSLSMRTLEDELGFQILSRSRTGVKLTEKGKRLLHIGNEFLQQLSDIQNTAEKKYQSTLTGTLEILATNGIIETLFPSLISQLFFDYPEFRLKPLSCEFSAITTLLLQDHHELALCYQLYLNESLITQYDSTRFEYIPLIAGRYYCMVPDNSPIAHYKTISLNTMAKYPIILYSPSKDVLLKLFSHTKNKANIIFAESFSIYKQLLKDGAGLSLTLISEGSQTSIVPVPNLKLLPFKEHINSSLGYLTRRNTSFSPRTIAFISYLVDYLNAVGISNYPSTE